MDNRSKKELLNEVPEDVRRKFLSELTDEEA